MADFAPHSKNPSNGTIYNNNDVFGGSSKFRISTVVDDYTEIFTSRSSIPFLDLPPETDSEISSIFDYSEIFGGFQDFENYAVPYQELFLESKSLEKETASSSSSEDVWTPAGSVSPSEDSFENPLTSESTQAFSNTESHYASDGAEQFSMSYHKANQIGKEDSISGTTRIAQLNAVPAYTLVVDENVSLQTTKFEEALPEVSKKHNLNELTNDSRMDEEHYWEAMPPQPASESTQTHEKNLDENKIYKKKPFMTVSEISLRTQPLEVPPPSRPPPKLSKQCSHKIMPSDLKPSAKYPRQGVANDSSPPFFDVEVDSTSSAAASAAAMKEAMEKAQATLKSAREMMGGLQRKKMGIKESSKLNEERPPIENGRMHSELKGFDKDERQKGIGTSHAANELKLKPRAVNAASVSVDRSHLKQPELSHEFLQREIIGEWKAEEQFYELVKKDTVETVLVAPKDKKSDRNVLPSPRLFDQDENEKKAGNAAFVQQEKSNGKPQASKKACESKEDEKRVNVSMDACERVEHEEKIKAAEIIHDQEELQKEERARQLKETLEREEAEKKVKAARAREENEKRRRDALQREETERREREENERREREAFEREENERREREAFEREEKEKREREALEREESEKREKEAYEREEKEKRLKEAREREEQERKLKEVERRLIEVREKEENERKLKEAHEREEQERKLKEAERRLIEVLEKEEKERKLKEAHDREERERIMKEVREREENETRLREIREKEENERRLKEQLEREEIQRKLLLAAEEEKKLRQARESEENERRLKEAREREDNERRLIEAREREEQEKILQEAHEREENGRRLREQLEREEHERRLKEELKREENQRKLAQAAEETERLLHEAQEREETERRIKEEHQREENEKRVRECQEKEENEKKLKQAAEENERRLKEVQKQEEIENISKESSEEVTEKLLLQDTFVKANVAAQKAKVDNSDKKTEIIEIAVREEKDRQQKKESITTSQMVGPSTNNGIKRDHEKEEIVKEKEQEKERLKKLEEEKQREREREKDRIAVESVTREAHERAFAEARERAERAAVERATTEVRQRAMVEARERLEKACAEAREKSLAEKAYAEAQARLRSERAAVERATTEARERAEKAMREKAMRDRVERSVSEKFSTTSRDSVLRHNASFSNTRDAQFQNSTSSFTGSQRYSDKSQGTECDSVQRCKAKLEREQRTVERAAKALAEKNSRDYLAQREQIERNRLAETLDADVKRWSNGKEGNLRALLSTLQYILGADSGWQPVPLTDVVTAVAVKKAYRKATLCVHPDKVQQRGANIQQKYVCEKVFDLLKDAWTKFNSEER